MIKSVAPFIALRTYSRIWSTVLVAMDVLVIAFAMYVANYVHPLPNYILIATVVILPLLLALTGTYRRSFAGSIRDEWYAIGAALAFVTVPLVFLTIIVPALWYTRTAIAIFAAISFVCIAGIRTFAHSQRVPRRIALVGVSDRIDMASACLHIHRHDAVLRVPVANIDDSFGSEREPAMPPWLQGALVWQASHIIITEALPANHMLRVAEEAARNKVQLSFAPPRFKLHSYRLNLQRDGDLALLNIQPLPIFTRSARIYKRTFDFVLSLVAILILSPIFILCALAVKLETPGPIIFRQERLGKNKKPFDIYKFRSMPVGSELKTGPVWANHKINKPTRVGHFLRRTSMDELPQFFNVLRGDMSLVGPRPERAFFIERFKHLPRYKDRLLVAPGITGWSQIGMSRMLTTEQIGLRLEGDLFYLQEWSPLLDVQILIKTFFEFLFHWVPQEVESPTK